MPGRGGPLSNLVGNGIGLVQEYRADRQQRKEAEELAARHAASASTSAATAPAPAPAPVEFSRSHLSPDPAEIGDRRSFESRISHDEKLPPHYSEDDDEDYHLENGEEWARDLDEVQMQTALSSNNPYRAPEKGGDEGQFVHDFATRHPPPPPYSEIDGNENMPSSSRDLPSAPNHTGHVPYKPLPMPVILPQRRPTANHRGFVRAWAPVLADAGIDQPSWMEFLDGFERSIKQNPWFNAANVAIFGLDIASMATAVSPAAMAVTMALTVSVEAGRHVYTTSQKNKYLDQMNEEFFKPRGLFCMVVKYKAPAVSQQHHLYGQHQQLPPPSLFEEVDLDSNTTRMVSHHDTQRKKWETYIRASSAKVRHDGEIPASAPLEFPALDALPEGAKQSSIKQFGAFLEVYHDRRAAARFEAEHPDSRIPTAPRKEFASKYSDPTHKAHRGGLISIATGGIINPGAARERRRQERGSRRAEGGGGDGWESYYGEQDYYGGRDSRGMASRREMRREMKGGRGGGGRPGLLSLGTELVGAMSGRSSPSSSSYSFSSHAPGFPVPPPPAGVPGPSNYGGGGFGGGGRGGRGGMTGGGGPIKGLKSQMKPDALYLMVVNMPSQEEMDAVMAEVNRVTGM